MANGYVRYGNSIHLDGFQILDFCIENAISLESLSDRNLGRKVFLTGNDTNEGYLRENVWDGTRWRAAAYLDDIAKVNEKLDLIFGDELDTDTIIDSWKEVQDFLSGIEDTKTLMTMLDGKLDKTGGTISKDGNPVPLTIKSTGEYAGLGLKIGENGRAVLAYYGGLDWRVTNESYQSEAKILHNLNFESLIGDTYLKTTGGTMTGGLTVPHLDVASASGNAWIRFKSGGEEWGYIGFAAKGRPKLHDGKGWYDLLYAGNYSDLITGTLGVDITGNAATATALKNKVSLWGNEFDGTKSLDALILFKNAGSLEWRSSSGSNISAMTLNDRDNLLIGQGVAQNEGDTLIYGNNIKFCYGTLGTSANTAMTITDEGNVLVGVASQTNTDFKFEVSGLSRIYTAGQSMSLGKVPTSGLVLGSSTGLQGQFYFDYSGNFCLQGQNVSDSTTRALNLNPLGGAVNVGSVNGHDLFTTYGGIKLAGGTDYQKIRSEGTIVIGADSGRIDLSAPTEIDFITSASNMLFNGTAFSPWTQHNNAISLGRSEARWSNVYSVLGNFSGRVLIGGAEDDADYALNVKGDSYFGGTVYIPSGQKLTIGSVTFEEDAAGRVKVGGDLYTTGTLASGGKAKEGTGTGSGSANVRDFELPADGKTTYDCDHLLKSKNVIVQVFEKTIQNYIEVWEMIVADVTIVTEDRVTVTFGRPTTKVHKVHIIGGNVS